MDDDHDPTKPLSREERQQQAELRRIAEEKQQHIDDEKARILAKDGALLNQQLDIKLIDDPDVRAAAAEEIARSLAERGARAGQIDWRDHRDVPNEAIGTAQAKVEAQRRQEEEAGKGEHGTEKAKDAQPQPETTSSQQQEVEKARVQQLLNTAEALRLPPARTAIEQYDRANLMSVHFAKEFAAKGDTSAQEWLNDQGHTLGTQDSAAAAWVAQAESPDRQHYQNGRYNALKGAPPNTPPSRDLPTRNPSPGDPTNSPPKTPPTPTNGPLSANDVLQRFAAPALQARYQQQEQRREQQIGSASSTPPTPGSVAVRGNAPSEKHAETPEVEAKKVFFKPITRGSREHEHEHRNERGGNPGGRGGRGR